MTTILILETNINQLNKSIMEMTIEQSNNDLPILTEQNINSFKAMFATDEKYRYYFGVIRLLRNQLGDKIGEDGKDNPMYPAFDTLNALVNTLCVDGYSYEGNGVMIKESACQ